MPESHRTVWALVVIACMALLVAPAIWNGFPLLEYDTGGYLARPFEGYLVPSRPAAYGLFIAATVPLHFWPAILIQSAVTIWVLSLVLRVYGFGHRPLLLLATIAALSILTALPFLTAILLTDIFAGLSVLALHLLVFRRDALSRTETVALIALVAFSGATHGATLFLLLGLLLAGLMLGTFAKSYIPRGGIRLAAIAVSISFILTFAANFAVSKRDIWTPGGFGIVFGRLIEDGVVARYLNDHCPDPALRLCPYKDELPKTADEFLWAGGIFNTLGRFEGMNDEMRTIVLGSLRDYPLLNLELAIRATARQMVAVATGEGVLTPLWHTYGIIERFTPSLVPAMRAAKQQQGIITFDAINRIHVPVALLSIALMALIAANAARRRSFGDIDQLAATIAVALLGNATICGVLSNPHDRYGARLVWVATLTAALYLLRPVLRWSPGRAARSLKAPTG